MPDDSRAENLSEIQTDWVDLILARHGGAEEAARQAQMRLLDRYANAIRRYVRVAFRDSNNVDEIYQDFAVVFLRGGFRNVDPGRGRFRDYLKTSLFRLVQAYKRNAGRFPTQLPDRYPEPSVDEPPMAEDEERFRLCWRDELISRAWRVLEETERRDGLAFAAVLRFCQDNQQLRSADVAEIFSAKVGHKVTEGQIRKTHKAARDHLQDALLSEIAQTLDRPSLDEIEDELRYLGLHSMCLKAILRRRAR